MFAASCLLFVPGSRPERFEKAAATGAGVIAIDLEDAVGPADKEAARQAALDYIGGADDRFAIRINGLMTPEGVRDLAVLTQSDALPAFLMVPMVEYVTELDVIANALGERCPALLPLIETPKGLRRALAIASHSKVAALMFGGADFSGELQMPVSWEPLLSARQQMVLACAEARTPLIDAPYIHLDDEQGLRAECEKARVLGIKAKAAIHPKQVPIMNEVFAPTKEQVAEAEEALRVYEETGGKAVRHNGRMLEAPMIKTYRAILAAAAHARNGGAV